jgi:hypothetical protein
MIDQRLHPIEKLHGVRQSSVQLERVFVPPPRVNVKKSMIAYRAKSLDAQAAKLLPRRTDHFPHGILKGVLLPGPCMKAPKNEQFHAPSSLSFLLLYVPSLLPYLRYR